MSWFRKTEDRTLTAPDVPSPLLPYSTTPPLNVTTATALRVSDAYACVRVLADSISSLPLHVYKRTPAGRVPAGDNSRAVQLLNRPSPGSTGVDLISQVMVHLNVHGDAFIGKYRSDGEIVQLGCIPPDSIQVELRGQRIVYTLDTVHGRTEHGPEDILHIKAMSLDGLRGLSPVTQCRVALGLSSSLQESARQYFENGSRPSGVLTAPSGNQEALDVVSAKWNHRLNGYPTLKIDGANLQIVSGSGTTDGSVNGGGNLFIGYHENPEGNDQTGSHNLILGANKRSPPTAD